MLLFSFTILPLFLAWFCIFFKDPKVIPAIFAGVVSAILVCAFRIFFLYSHRVIPYSLSQNFYFLLFRQFLIPIVVLYGIFFFISKDDKEYKIKHFFPLELSFFMVYMPYSIVSYSEGLYSWFSLFYKPLLCGCLIVQLSILLRWIVSCIDSKKIFFVILFAIAAIIYLCIPALLEAMVLINSNTILVVFVGLVYILIPAAEITLQALGILKV